MKIRKNKTHKKEKNKKDGMGVVSESPNDLNPDDIEIGDDLTSNELIKKKEKKS